jgi:hypothetical protein
VEVDKTEVDRTEVDRTEVDRAEVDRADNTADTADKADTFEVEV